MRFIAMASRLIKPGDLFASGGSRPLAEKSPPSQGIILYGEGYTGLDLFDWRSAVSKVAGAQD